MKAFFTGLYYSFPVQLVFLHFKRFQVLLLFWYLLFSTVGGKFMNSYGADSLFLAPEYLGEVNMASAAILGFAIAIFIMSWNISLNSFGLLITGASVLMIDLSARKK